MTERTHFQDFPSSEIDGIFLERLAESKDGRKILANITKEPGDGCWTYATWHYWDGYRTAMWCGKSWKLHRLAYELTRGPLGKLYACHSCDVRSCLRPSHIWAGTAADNQRDMAVKGHTNAKISPDDARKIWDLLREDVPHKEIASRLGVSRGIVRCIDQGITWRHVTDQAASNDNARRAG